MHPLQYPDTSFDNSTQTYAFCNRRAQLHPAILQRFAHVYIVWCRRGFNSHTLVLLNFLLSYFTMNFQIYYSYFNGLMIVLLYLYIIFLSIVHQYKHIKNQNYTLFSTFHLFQYLEYPLKLGQYSYTYGPHPSGKGLHYILLSKI